MTGDTPVLLGPDGPSLGGFICPASVPEAELWKVGQVTPLDTVRFRELSLDEATVQMNAQDRSLSALKVRFDYSGRWRKSRVESPLTERCVHAR